MQLKNDVEDVLSCLSSGTLDSTTALHLLCTMGLGKDLEEVVGYELAKDYLGDDREQYFSEEELSTMRREELISGASRTRYSPVDLLQGKLFSWGEDDKEEDYFGTDEDEEGSDPDYTFSVGETSELRTTYFR